jgi:hypothetical protein
MKIVVEEHPIKYGALVKEGCKSIKTFLLILSLFHSVIGSLLGYLCDEMDKSSLEKCRCYNTLKSQNSETPLRSLYTFGLFILSMIARYRKSPFVSFLSTPRDRDYYFTSLARLCVYPIYLFLFCLSSVYAVYFDFL